MPPISKETDVAAACEPAAARDKIQARHQTVALEVPVTVNGGRAVEGSDQREPFSESTKTVLVHGNGAVIRLNSPVAPGQLLFLTNERTKKEIVCQVLKSKGHSDMSGYVELEFTEAVAGFWGMRFPGQRSAAQPRSATPVTTPAPSIEAQLEPLSAAPTPEEMAKAQLVLDSKKDASQFTGLVTADAAKPVPFTPELKSSERATTKADFFESTLSAAVTPLEREAPPLQEKIQEQISSPAVVNEARENLSEPSLGFTDPGFASAATKLLEMSQADSTAAKFESSTDALEPPAKEKGVLEESSLKAEEVKVPAWLAHPGSAAQQDQGNDRAPILEKAEKFETEKPAATLPVRKPRRSEPSAPVFGRTLLDRAALATEPRAASGKNKGVWILGAAALMVLSAAGVTWYLRQPIQPEAPRDSLSAATVPIASASTAPNPTSGTDLTNTQNAAPAEVRPTETKGSSGVTSDPSDASAQIQTQPVVLSEPVGKASSDRFVTPSSEPAVEVEPIPSKPSIGKVRLAKPRTIQRTRTSSVSVAEPVIEIGDQSLGTGDSLGTGLVTDSAAPARPAGGDVVSAQLISSAPPVYPPAARAQHVSGDVQVDALIDAKGRVSSMKVISGPPLLHHAAKDALRQWKYQPATLNGSPVAIHLIVTIQFHLQ